MLGEHDGVDLAHGAFHRVVDDEIIVSVGGLKLDLCADEAFLRLGREVKERGLTPAGDPRVLGIVAPYTGREIETKRYCSRLVLPVEGEAEASFPV